jgi:lipopolysaccharide transport system ATP-binding protein
MPATVIEVENLGKQYLISHRNSAGGTTLREELTESVKDWGRRLLSSNAQRGRENLEAFWALKDVSFQVEQGEVVGIIGRNGAGKSTLLKLLSRITEPTTGRIALRGRLSSLLEVGTGFHPELTGRENIFLNGAILGMTRADIRRKFDAIVAFAEIDKFLDTPVKRYSSGMYVRLAFAVAAHLEPDILVIDEVLAVGDAAFQKKCLARMDDVARHGMTVLLISHNMLSIQSLCNRVLWLQAGQIRKMGSASEVVGQYLQTASSALPERIWTDPATAPGNDEVRLHRACVRPLEGAVENPVSVARAFVMEFEFWNLRPNASLYVNLQLYSPHGLLIFESAPVHETQWLGRSFPVGLFRFTCHVPADLLNNGVHRAAFFLVRDEVVILHKEDDILVFEVEDSNEHRGGWLGPWDGVVRPILQWDTELVEPRIAGATTGVQGGD